MIRVGQSVRTRQIALLLNLGNVRLNIDFKLSGIIPKAVRYFVKSEATL